MKNSEILLVLLLILFVNTNIYNQQNDKSRIIAAYINNFAQYTKWQNEDNLDSFRITLVTDDKSIISEFREFSKKRKIKNKPISLVILKEPPVPLKSNIIFLTSDESVYLTKIYDAIEGKPILLVSEEIQEKRNIMINLYQTPQQELKFEVNKANILNQNLTIDPEILLYGGTEVDIASLYRKSQQSLRDLQRNIDRIVDSLSFLRDNINTSLRIINEQKGEVDNQRKIMDEYLEKNKSLEEDLKNQKQILSQQTEMLEHQKDSVREVNDTLKNKMIELNKKEKLIEDYENNIKTRQLEIESLNNEIKNKNVVLDSQSEIISWQKKMLILSIITGVLILILIITIYTSYRHIKRQSAILSEQKKDIESKLIELEQLNTKLKNADQYKSIFLASMSHELRTPLNSIIGYTGILLMGMTGKLNEEQNKQLNKVKNNAKHLLSLINDILDISKIEADRVELQIEEVNLASLISQIVDTVLPKANEKGLEITYNIQEDIVVQTDVRRIKQVILNLVANAINYSERGNIKIYSDKIDADKFRLTVKDTGIGIAESEQERLFQPFQQIDSSLTKKNSGTGLGLYLCRKLMTLLGGDIFVKSQKDVGSEFYIEMPYNKK